MNKNVLLGNMACIADYGNSNERYQKFLQNGLPPFRSLIESLVLFDQVIIPTNDFMPLALLLGVLGERLTTELLESDTVKFARFIGSIGYVGNGGGVSVFQVFRPDKKTPTSFSAPSDEVIRLIADGVANVSDKGTVRKLALQSTIEFSLAPEKADFAKLVYDEVARSPHIISATGVIELNRLPGINSNQVRGLSSIVGADQGDDIFQVLRVAQATMEARAAETCLCDDVYTSDQVSELFRTAMGRVSDRIDPSTGFGTLRELANLPDVGGVALQNKPIIQDILKLRNSAAGTQFRIWFHENCRGDPKLVANEYISLLKALPLVQSSGVRAIRFLSQVAIGAAMVPFDPMIGLGAGATASAIDSYLVERLFKGSSPKVFLERLTNITPDSRSMGTQP